MNLFTKTNKEETVIDTLTNDFPLNVMYWAVREDGNFEVIDGQQRTISICQYVEQILPIFQVFSQPAKRRARTDFEL